VAEVVTRRWAGSLGGSGLSRKDSRPCEYGAYVPDPLVGRRILLDGEVAADVADAEAAITRLNAQANALVDTEALARILLRAEAVASARIEGLVVGARRLLHAEVGRGLSGAPADVTAHEVLNNIDAMVHAVTSVSAGDSITPELLRELHKRLLRGTRIEDQGGRFRAEQNWIGGSGYNPCSADFVPPPHELVEDLIGDLCAFCGADDLPAVAQAALAHAQFETIHPFVDGNGRTGRALIHMVLRRRGLAERVLPPVSLVLATLARSYVEGLTAFRYVGSATSPLALEGTNDWIGRFASACTRSVRDATAYETRAAKLEATWRAQLGTVRMDSATDRILRILPGAPILTVEGAARLLGRTYNPANDAIRRLVEVGILRQITIGRRNRAYEAPEIIDAFTALERQLASPAGDTRTSDPVRRVPDGREACRAGQDRDCSDE
jgi:Fic family protein